MGPKESFRVLRKAVDSEQLWVTYTFEELNMTSFQNAFIWQLKKQHPNIKVTVASPSSFIDLYSFADSKRVLPDSFVENYGEIQNYSEFKYSDWRVHKSFATRWIRRIRFAWEAAPQWVFRRLPPIFYHRLPFGLKAHGRSKVFYKDSGFREHILKEMPAKTPLLESCSNFNTETLGFGTAHNQARFFNHGFKTIAEIIRTGQGFSSIYLENVLVEVPERLTHLQRAKFKKILIFLEENPKSILLRTRNKTIATSNNASVDSLIPFIEAMAKDGYGILNVGAPAQEIRHPGVENLTHSLPPALLMAIGARFDYVATSCGGDFFTGWSCVPYPLVVFDTEWSTEHLADPSSLLQARRIAGIKDLRITPNGLRSV